MKQWLLHSCLGWKRASLPYLPKLPCKILALMGYIYWRAGWLYFKTAFFFTAQVQPTWSLLLWHHGRGLSLQHSLLWTDLSFSDYFLIHVPTSPHCQQQDEWPLALLLWLERGPSPHANTLGGLQRPFLWVLLVTNKPGLWLLKGDPQSAPYCSRWKGTHWSWRKRDIALIFLTLSDSIKRLRIGIRKIF